MSRKDKTEKKTRILTSSNEAPQEAPKRHPKAPRGIPEAPMRPQEAPQRQQEATKRLLKAYKGYQEASKIPTAQLWWHP